MPTDIQLWVNGFVLGLAAGRWFWKLEMFDSTIRNAALDDHAQMRQDNALMANALRGVTPDQNTQTEAEAADTAAAIEVACARALREGK